MAFKLKHSNVSATGQKLSPFKVDLVQGAKDAASKFSNVGGAFERGRTPSIEPETESTTEEAEVVSKEKTCTEQELEGDALVKCQEAAKLKLENTENTEEIVAAE